MYWMPGAEANDWVIVSSIQSGRVKTTFPAKPHTSIPTNNANNANAQMISRSVAPDDGMRLA